MLVRNASIGDLPTIVSIYNSIIPGRMVTADIEEVSVADKSAWFLSHTPTRPIWMFETENNQIIGWASFKNFYGRPAYSGTAEFSMYLAENFRSKGYGSQILNYAIQQSPSLQIHSLLGFIFEQNTPSISLVKKAGFEEWGHLPDVAILDGKSCSLKILGRKV
jgi:phosphinothricin acetyltransferase